MERSSRLWKPPGLQRNHTWEAVGWVTGRDPQGAGELHHLSLLAGIQWLEGWHCPELYPCFSSWGTPCRPSSSSYLWGQLGQGEVPTHPSPPAAFHVAATRPGPREGVRAAEDGVWAVPLGEGLDSGAGASGPLTACLLYACATVSTWCCGQGCLQSPPTSAASHTPLSTPPLDTHTCSGRGFKEESVQQQLRAMVTASLTGCPGNRIEVAWYQEGPRSPFSLSWRPGLPAPQIYQL